jgi:hypothetical protein
MKYIKGEQSYKIESCKQGKIRMHDGKGFAETLWIAEDPNGKDSILINHAVAFTPHVSWGAVIPARGSFNFLEMLNKQELVLHPEAFDQYVKQGIIDDAGYYVEKKNKKKKK